MHIHVQKAEMEAKYWIDANAYEIKEAYSFMLSPRDSREVKRLIYQHLDYIIEQWILFHGKK
jgi:hypothetical protein